jgi:hypothetical protein
VSTWGHSSDDAGAAAGQLLFDALENIDLEAAPDKHDAGQKPAHRAADNERAAFPRHAKIPLIPKLS